MCYVYILYSAKSDRFYVGSTNNLNDRIQRHNSGRSKYTKPGGPWELVYSKEYATKADAVKAEMYIKAQKSRNYIDSLIDILAMYGNIY